MKHVRDHILVALNPEGEEGLTCKQVWRRIGLWSPVTINTELGTLAREGVVARQRQPGRSPQVEGASLWWRRAS